MARWAAFAGLTVLSVSLFLALARASQTMMSDGAGRGVDATDGIDDVRSPESSGSNGLPDDRFDMARSDRPDNGIEGGAKAEPEPEVEVEVEVETNPFESMPTSALLLNVAFSQGVFGGLVLLGAWYTEVPLEALGVSGVEVGTLALGAGLGVALYAGNELVAAGANAFGFSTPEELRALLAPDSVAGWVLLLLVILPTIAFVEELLFRAALIGALSAGFSVSPWPLAIVSSIAFALGHGAQGSVGMIVTGSLGLVLAAAFVLTGSLLVVVLAHYLVNALEFVVHEGLGVDWSD